ILALALGIGIAAPAPSHAQASLDAAKQSGLIGERPDGLVGFVADMVPADIRSLVEQINAQRMRRYDQVAATNGTPVDSVQAMAGRQLIDRTLAGQYVLSASGRWVKK
ncbi:MAG TPA: YdbL family protein, partial [Skermanella sp.]|nr:YdbL family protein [Skermanella sp.]